MDRKTIDKNKVLDMLVETYAVPTWGLMEVIFPLVLIAVVGLLLKLIEKNDGVLEYTLGNGSLFILAILLLVGVVRTRMQARTFSKRLERDINWSNFWESLIFVIEIIFTVVYAVNVFIIYYCGIVEETPLEAILIRLRTWSNYGLIGVGIAVSFALATMLATRKALLKARIPKVKVSR